MRPTNWTSFSPPSSGRCINARKAGICSTSATALDGAAADPRRIVAAFTAYMERGDGYVTRAMFERNLAAKVRDPQFSADIGPLLVHGYRWEMDEAARKIGARLFALLPGVPWKGEE